MTTKKAGRLLVRPRIGNVVQQVARLTAAQSADRVHGDSGDRLAVAKARQRALRQNTLASQTVTGPAMIRQQLHDVAEDNQNAHLLPMSITHSCGYVNTLKCVDRYTV